MLWSSDKFTVEIPFNKGGRTKGRGKKKVRPVRGRGRKTVQGATRKVEAVVERPRMPTAWLNRGLILLGAAVVLVAGVKAYLTLQSIPVQHISVTGELETAQAESVQELVQVSLGGGFLKADLQRIRTELEGLPWIYEATVRRKWPSALEIHVVKQLPIARWGDNGLLNHAGGVFYASGNGDWSTLPLLVGPPGSAQALMAKYQRLLEILAPLDLSVQQLALDERGQLEAVLAVGTRLILGGEDFLGRMNRFVSIYRSELGGQGDAIARVDLRYEAGMAVTFNELSPVTAF